MIWVMAMNLFNARELYKDGFNQDGGALTARILKIMTDIAKTEGTDARLIR
jgi:hypothetical protein